jgi:hypothetical protein
VISVDGACRDPVGGSLPLDCSFSMFSQTFNFQLLTFNFPSSLSPLPATLMDLPASVANKRLTACLSSLNATLTKTRGWVHRRSDAGNLRRDDVQAFGRFRPIAAERPWCNNERRRENSSPSGETTPLSPVSNNIERTSGTARSWSPLQVVPGSIVLKLDRTARWPVFQQRVGKAGSVRLG